MSTVAATPADPVTANARADHPALELRDVRKTYGAEVAVESLSLVVNAGEFVTLLGPSGSGKSTTLAMIAGFVEPTGGDLRVADRPMRGVPPEHRDIGMVFQNYALFPHLSVEDNLRFPLRMRRIEKREAARRVEDMLQRLGLGRVGHRLPRELSGGQQQRVALGRALIFGPQVLLMDEPLGALDRALREDLQQEIKRIVTESGATTIYVTHDQAEALNLSDRIAVMRSGRIEQIGSPVTLYREPATAFVATFLGRATLCDATVIDVERDAIRVRIPKAADLAATVRVPSGEQPRRGETRQIVVRPEDVRLRPTADGRGRISNEVFFGEITKRRVQLQDIEFGVDDPSQRQPVGIGTCVELDILDAWCVAGPPAQPDS